MLTHDDVQSCFESVFPAGQPNGGVFMVSRFQCDDLKLPHDRAHVFIPDCHILRDADAQCYPKNHFKLKSELEAFIRGLAKLKSANRGALTVWCLGDFFDFWRARGNLGDQGELDAITAEYGSLMTLVCTSAGVRAEMIAGNHDYPLHLLRGWSARRFALLENQQGEGDILILHGDAFSATEKIPAEIKKLAVKLATWVSSGKQELDKDDQKRLAAENRNLADGDKPIGADKVNLDAAGRDDGNGAVNVVDPEGGNKGATKYYQEARELAFALKKHGHDIRAVVMGHSHSARIVAGSRRDKVPFALLDCGAWFGKCRLSASDPWIMSAQVGVIVASEMRIYQLGSRRA
jgi:UDP-2,3-diacylglucosamine pyrophosphatase LpxH